MAKVVVFLMDGYNETQVEYTFYRAQEDALRVEFVSMDGGKIEGLRGTTTGTASITDVSPSTIDILIIPGGHGVNQIENIPNFVEFVETLNDRDCVIGAIGSGVVYLSKSRVLEGRLVATAPAHSSAVQTAGGNCVEYRVSVDKNIVTAPSDNELPFFLSAVLHAHSIPQRSADEALERTHWA